MKLALALGTVALLMAPALTAGADTDAVVNVTIFDNGYNPADLTIHLGDTVVWKNTGARPHTVTFIAGANSGNIAPGNTYTQTPALPGVFVYYCFLHQITNMRATLTVLP